MRARTRLSSETPSDRAMTIDVVVVAYRSAAHLRACVEPLAREEDLRVIVVDNACPEDSPATVADLPIEIVEMGHNAGFAAACNAGARRGSGEGILFLNPDAVMTPGDVRVLAAGLEGDQSRAAVAPRILAPTGETERSMFRQHPSRLVVRRGAVPPPRVPRRSVGDRAGA